MTVPDENKTPEKGRTSSEKQGVFSNIYSIIGSAIAIGLLGFSIGVWVSNVDHKNELLQKELEYQKLIVSEREKWEERQKEESKLDEIVKLLSAVEISNKE